jgi:hypothetical protein
MLLRARFRRREAAMGLMDSVSPSRDSSDEEEEEGAEGAA